MSIEANKAVVQRYLEMWDTGNLDIADEVLAPDFVDHTRPHQAPGPEGVKENITTFRSGFPDATHTITHMIGEGDTVAFRFARRGKHKGMFAGFPPTGKEIILTGADFLRVADGKIVELWSSQDGLNLAQQLGMPIGG